MINKTLMTAQEHKLIGSTVDEKYYKQPYKPLAVISGTLTVEECNRRRKAESRLEGCIARYWGMKGFGAVTLEPLVLDSRRPEYGQTIRDPILMKGPPKNDGYLPNLMHRFPYKRK